MFAGGLDAPQPVGAYFNGVFPATAPGSATGWTSQNAFPNLTFIDPMWLAEIPGTNEFLLVGKNGQLWRFPNNPAVTQEQVVKVLDVSAKTQTSEDQGFYRLAFHPQFGQVGSPNANYVYVTYSHKPALAGADADHSYWRLSRFTWLPGSGTIDPASEMVLINQYDPHRWHNGGGIFFGTDGFLYTVVGDGSEWIDSNNTSQHIDQGLLSGILRIDVNNDPAKSHAIARQPVEDPIWGKPVGWPQSSTQGYGIPNNNPWQNPGNVLEEFYAIGFRSPHTMHYDAVTGDIYVGDVGQGTREELTRVTAAGANAQWGYQEGTVAGPKAKPVPLIGVDQVPLVDYGRDVGGCIIGGMRYRGAKWNSLLGGKVLYGDHLTGEVWSATLDSGGGAPVIEELVSGGFIVGNKAGLANFCTDSTGEVYMMNLNGTNQDGGTILKLTTAGVSVEPPALLSQTGVFTNLATLQTAQGVIPYDVANPLWSDGAAKKRWMILPNDGTHDTPHEDIVFSEEGNWVFPAGTVFVKHFEIGTDENNPAAVKRLETRFLICTAGGGKYGVTYKWNAAGTDAVLLTSGVDETYNVALAGGGTETRTWSYPSRAQCLLCHNAASGQALGVRTHSLNRSFHYNLTGRDANQLETFNELGMFDQTLTAEDLANFIEARSLDDETAPLEHRVRSYLDSNCSHCHRPGGPVSYFDARLGTPLNVQGLINGMIQGHFSMGPDGRYLKPSDPELSALHVRLSNVGNGAAMPPLAKNVVDQKAVDLLQEYLESLTAEEFTLTPSPQARYIMLSAYSEVHGYDFTSVGEFSVLDGNGVPIPISEQSIAFVNSEELVDAYSPASRIIDGNIDSFWHTAWEGTGLGPLNPNYVGIDLGSVRSIGGFVYTPRQQPVGGPVTDQNGRIASYDVHYSNDMETWTQIDHGTWPNSNAAQRFDGLAGKRKARCHIGGPVGAVNGPFDVTIVFDMDVADFTAADVQVAGGTVTGLRGKGYYYVASISPIQPSVTVSVPADKANLGGLGSRASNSLGISYEDLVPPAAVLTGMPVQVSGAFLLHLSFGEPVTGFAAPDLVLTNATLNTIVPDGDEYVLNLTATAEGAVMVRVADGAVTDIAGNPSTGTAATTVNFTRLLARNANEYFYIGGGMQIVTSAGSPVGHYMVLPDGDYPNNQLLPVKTQHRAEYRFVVPYAGQWRLRGLVRPASSSSDSFWIEIDGNQAAGTVYQWDANPLGSAYVWDLVSNFGGADPVVLNLTAGQHTVTVYGRDDGTRLARLELESVRPFAALTGPTGGVDGPFQATLEFSESVTGLGIGDFAVSGATVTAVNGSGSSYTVSLTPLAPVMTISLAQNTVTSGTGAGNFASNSILVVGSSAYQQWAALHGLDGLAGTQLADEDGDGIPKLLEFAFNLDPTKAKVSIYNPALLPASGLPRMFLAPGPVLTLQYIRRKGDTGLTYTPQFGSSPGVFTNAIGVPLVESLDADWERVTIPDSGAPGATKRFGRVLVTLAAP
ncbi:Ig-like domain-containing protein [Luteolibacter soli]|uniref:Ig-like domain-containing protein n=1 Tax=Luteolibacter soli TaxID=3135280 RepID=A0ABU9AP92_9BACT